MNIFFYFFIFLLFFSNAHSQIVNCLDHKIQKNYKTLCRSILDPIKFKAKQKKTINCTDDLEDGYTVGICEKISLAEQKKMRGIKFHVIKK